MQIAPFGFEITLPVLVLGIITGMTYGLLAVGLVLIYRSNRIINFAHGEVGAFAAAVFGLSVTRWQAPYWMAFPLAIVLAAGIGAIVEIVVVRRLRSAPKVMSIVATLGFSQFLLLFSAAVNSQAKAGISYPQPPNLPRFGIGSLLITPAYSGMLILSPLLVAGLAIFLRRSRIGLAIRGSSANPDVARTAGIFATRMSTLSWAIAGAVSAFTAILFFPTRGFVTAESLGPSLLLRALIPAIIARMSNLPTALLAGIGIGILEQELLWNYPSGGFVEMILFAIILLALLLQPRVHAREEEKGSWTALLPWKPLPDSYLRVWSIRNLGKIVAGVGLLLALLVPAVATNRTAIILVGIAGFALVGLSLSVVTGLAGQLSLGQFALAGIGATVSFHITSRTGNFFVGFVVAAIAAAAVSAVIGIPALRIKGLMLAATTLSFALMAQSWLLQQPWMLGAGVNPGRPIIGSLTLDTGKKYYFATIALLIVGVWLTRNIRGGGIGRALIALRDNEDAARAFTVPAVRRKLEAFALSGLLAGLGGAVYGHGLAQISFQTFSPQASIGLVAMTVIGGIGILAGPLIGAFYIIGIPAFLPLDSAGLAATSLGWLILILYFPGGLAQLVRVPRDRLVTWLARRHGLDPLTSSVDDASGIVKTSTHPLIRSTRSREIVGDGRDALLDARELSKRFGGVQAVDSVTIKVFRGETLGLIGPNGAGKTTLFELLGGFVSADEGQIVFSGRDITRLGPERRARLGIIRSFQDASLFQTMTVVDTIRLSLERVDPTRFISSALGLPGKERRKDQRAREVVEAMGLTAYGNVRIGELSTGTRRLVELACVIGLEPTLLLLDEPSSGIAQRETEALADVLANVRQHLDVTMVIIEHDIPLVSKLSDRMLAMESGRVIAEGSPQHVLKDPAVVESYLGMDAYAIQRSGAAPGTDAAVGRCRGVIRSGARCSRPSATGEFCRQHAKRQHLPS